MSHSKKLKKSSRKDPTPLEDEVAQAIYDLEVNNVNLKPSLSTLYVNTAKEVPHAQPFVSLC